MKISCFITDSEVEFTFHCSSLQSKRNVKGTFISVSGGGGVGGLL